MDESLLGKLMKVVPVVRCTENSKRLTVSLMLRIDICCLFSYDCCAVAP